MIVRIVLLFLLLTASAAQSAEIRLAWDPNSESDLGGYKVYHGTASHTYGVPKDAGNVVLFTVTGLDIGTEYYFAVTAYDTSQNESGYSNEVSGYPQHIKPDTVKGLSIQ